ncbi:MAG: asparaginase domain-containing protein [Thermodesulfobacteriota bacterium]
MKPKIAVFSGPTATIQNSPPLITSNKARPMHGLPLRTNPDGSPILFDHLVPQRLAAPVKVLIEQFSAHPLEKDAAHLYGPPDGYLDSKGFFSASRQNPDDKPVYKVTLLPEDGLYLLPYMAMQADGKPWDGIGAFAGAPPEKCRQTFYPDASRIFEEIDRTIDGRDGSGRGNLLASKAAFDFYRAAPSGGYTKGLAEEERTDINRGDIRAELMGEDFFPYRPHRTEVRRQDLARATNTVQQALKTGAYAGAIWLEGSPTVQDTTYWLNLLIDTRLPISGNAAQRVHGLIGNEGDRNIIDSVEYILSKVWADQEGSDEIGAVLLQDEQIFAARQVEKQDARPGGYRATGGHGGILGTIGDPGPVTIWFKPTTLHTWKSAVNLTRIPRTVQGIKKVDGKLTNVEMRVKDDDGLLRGDAIPNVTSVRYHRWSQDTSLERPEEEVEILARIEKNLKDFPLAGLVVEGNTPYGTVSRRMEKAFDIAALSGMPVVRVSRGDAGGMVPVNPLDLTIEGNNLTAGKARLLLMAALMKFGSLPPAADPQNPTPEEIRALQEKINQYQEVFNTH